MHNAEIYAHQSMVDEDKNYKNYSYVYVQRITTFVYINIILKFRAEGHKYRNAPQC